MRPITLTLNAFVDIMKKCNYVLFYPIRIFGFDVDLILICVFEVLLGISLGMILKLFNRN